MPYNLVQAGAATGKSKSTILRAVKSGLISANQSKPNAGWSIEPSELHRVFPPVSNGTERNPTETPEFRQLEARLQDMQATVDDLRRRLDIEGEERRRLTAILADQRSTTPAAQPVSPLNKSSDDLTPRKNRGWLPWRRRRT